MMLPLLPTKGLWARGNDYYENVGGAVAFASLLGCDSIVLLGTVECTPAKLSAAFAAGLKVWVYRGPDSWLPSNWRETRDALKAICASDPRIAGYVANVERINAAPDAADQRDCWGKAPVSEVLALGNALNEDSQTLSVGFASFPAWTYYRTIGKAAPHVWGSPELYGLSLPPPSISNLLSWGERWREALTGGYVPSLAAWKRNAVEQQAYLNGLKSLPACIFWHEKPIPSGLILDAIRDFKPGT